MRLGNNQVFTDKPAASDYARDLDHIPVIPLEDHVLKYTYHALKINKWNRTYTAKTLNISIRSLFNKINDLKKLGLVIPDNK